MSRSDLSELTGLSQGTVTRLVNDLLARGFLDEGATRATRSGRGRPHVLLSLSDRAGLILGVHVGVDKLHVGLVKLDGEVVRSSRDVRHDNTVEGVVSAIAETMGSFTADISLLGATVVTAGWVDSARGTVRGHPGIPGWDDVPLSKLLSERLGLPVSIDSSIRASAVADLLFGHADEALNFIHVFLGNVTGVAMVMNRRVVQPANGGGGLVVDWLVSDRNGVGASAKALLTQNSMVRRAREAGAITPTGDLQELLRVDHPVAREILEDRAAAVSSLLHDLNELVSPDAIFVTSSVELVEIDQLGGSRLDPAPGAQTESGPEIRYVDSQTHSVRAAAASFVEGFLRNPIAHNGILTASEADV